MPAAKRPRLDWTDPKILRDLKHLTPTNFVIRHHAAIATVANWRRRLGFTRPYHNRVAMPPDFAQHCNTATGVALAHRYRVSLGTVVKWRHACGWTCRGALDARMMDLARRARLWIVEHPRHSASMIAKALGVTKNTVLRACSRHGVPLERSIFTKETAYVVLRAAGFNLEEIAAAVRTTRQEVSQRLARHVSRLKGLA